ncbi:MAG: DsbA family protein [Rickettsiales bacterium]|nr:DsbA family protein [Rickettsiales bacterium]
MRIVFFVIIFLYTHFALAKKVDAIHLMPMADDIVIGDNDAPNVIIEYSSLSCPLCGYFHANVFPKIEEKYLKTKKVKFIFRNFPIKPVDLKAGAISLCVPEDKKEVFLKVLFRTQRNWSVETSSYSEILEVIAKLGRVDGDMIKKCLEDKGLEDRVIKIREYAQNNLKVNSTPTFIINGKKFNGVIDMVTIEQELSS